MLKVTPNGKHLFLLKMYPGSLLVKIDAVSGAYVGSLSYSTYMA